MAHDIAAREEEGLSAVQHSSLSLKEYNLPRHACNVWWSMKAVNETLTRQRGRQTLAESKLNSILVRLCRGHRRLVSQKLEPA
jgi:hypothetical protein